MNETSIIVTGRVFALAMLIVLWIFMLWDVEMAKKQLPPFRKLTGLDALPERRL